MKAIKNPELPALLLKASKMPTGYSASEISGYSAKDVGEVSVRLEKKGQLHRVKVSHKVVRYFDTAARAMAFADTLRGQAVGVTIKDRRMKFDESIIVTDAPPPKYTPATPAPDHRFSVNPSAIRPGAFLLGRDEIGPRWSDYAGAR